MRKNVNLILKLSTLVAAAVVATACEAQKSETPTSPNVAGPIAGVGITSPSPRSPINGQEVINSEPLRLVFSNSVTNGVRPLYYFVEVAADREFNARVYMNPKVMPSGGEQNTVVVDAKLDAEKTYFWRVRADDGANSSEYSATASFDLVVPVALGAPVSVSPGGGQTLSGRTAQLVVNNGSVQGRAGDVRYIFDVASDPAFTNLVFVGNVPRSNGSTTSITTSELPAGGSFHWRAYASNGTVSSPVSGSLSFRTPAPTPAPTPTPTPTPGPTPGNSQNWTNDQWRTWFFDLVARRGLPNATESAMGALRGELLSMGVDWQNGWRGDYRPRIFLPVPNCPYLPSNPSAPGCVYNRPVDVGENGLGRAWTWVPR